MGSVHVIGGGLAGSEACWQLLKRGHQVTLWEQRPLTTTKAHKTEWFAELVCSNSLKSERMESAAGILKHELAGLESIILSSAIRARVPAGQALAVDRQKFSEFITQILSEHPRLTIRRQELKSLPSELSLKEAGQYYLIATGPLTSAALADSLREICLGKDHLYFYDAIAPIINEESLDMSKLFWGDRYGEPGVGDYLNVPLTREQYHDFVAAVKVAEYSPLHDFENTKYFEACLPIEVMAERGIDTLRFGPLKPVGLRAPDSADKPYAVIQLRKENPEGSMLSMVGFQTKMKWPEQKRVFSMLPGFSQVEFFRYGSVHRNTYCKSPSVLASDLSFRKNSHVFLAGQLTGVEGYLESTSMGLLAALAIDAKINDRPFIPPPIETMLGALHNYVTRGPLGEFQPMNCNFGLLPTLSANRRMSKVNRRQMISERARENFASWYE